MTIQNPAPGQDGPTTEGTPSPAEGKKEHLRKFWPDHVTEQVIVMGLVLCALLVIAVFRPASGLSGVASFFTGPTKLNTQWYLFFLYAFRKVLSSQMMLALFILLGAILIALPFFDRRAERHPRKRPFALIFAVAVFLAFAYMAAAGLTRGFAAGTVAIEGMKNVHCSMCHTYLNGKPTGFQPSKEACLKCHDEMNGKEGAPTVPHASSTVMNFDCWSCHKPHTQDKPVSCSSCHKDAGTVGLHKQAAHQNCTSCHKLHKWTPPADRATCLTCHTNKQNHMGNIVCTTCHSFK